ncbi:MAG: hypothetical protein RLZZ196_1638 [Bacteroidota bacterium]|jgi:hypothetical protein
MEQVSWMLSLIPDSVLDLIYWAIIGAGITGLFAGWFGKFIPFYGKYVSVLKPVGIALLVLGVWLRGGYDTEMIWRNKVAELEKKVAEAESKSQSANKTINTKIVTKTVFVKEKGKKQIQYIDRIVKGDTTEITKDMSEEERKAFLAKQKELEESIKNCPVPKLIVQEINKAADPK